LKLERVLGIKAGQDVLSRTTFHNIQGSKTSSERGGGNQQEKGDVRPSPLETSMKGDSSQRSLQERGVMTKGRLKRENINNKGYLEEPGTARKQIKKEKSIRNREG